MRCSQEKCRLQGEPHCDRPQTLAGRAAPFDWLAAKHPKSVVDLLKRALAKDLERRYPSALVLSKDLQEILGLKPDETNLEDYPTQILDFTLEHEVVAKDDPAPQGKKVLNSLCKPGIVFLALYCSGPGRCGICT